MVADITSNYRKKDLLLCKILFESCQIVNILPVHSTHFGTAKLAVSP